MNHESLNRDELSLITSPGPRRSSPKPQYRSHRPVVIRLATASQRLEVQVPSFVIERDLGNIGIMGHTEAFEVHKIGLP